MGDVFERSLTRRRREDGGPAAAPDWRGLDRLTELARAAQSIDIANVHLRGSVAAVVNRYLEVRARLARRGFTGPLWVTEHGYAAEPEFQSDPAFRGGEDAQARYLTQSLVGLGEAGAEQVFVTLRDQGTGAYAIEGLARISEAPGHAVWRRPAFAAVRRVALNWDQLMAWRADQRRHEQLQRDTAAAASLWREQAITGRQRLRQARALLAELTRPGIRRLRRAPCSSPATGTSSAGSGRCWPTTASAPPCTRGRRGPAGAHRRPVSDRNLLSSARP